MIRTRWKYFFQQIYPEHICLPWSFQVCVSSRLKSTGLCWWRSNRLSKSYSQSIQPQRWESGSNYLRPLAFEVLLISNSRCCENQDHLTLWARTFNGKLPIEFTQFWIRWLLTHLNMGLREYNFGSMHQSVLLKWTQCIYDSSQSVVTLLSDIALDIGKKISFRVLCSALKGWN